MSGMGSAQQGYSPPGPTLRMLLEQSAQRCWPRARPLQSGHS